LNKVFLSLGSNLGNRLENLTQALENLQQKVGNIVKISSVYETDPWGFSNQDKYLNMVIEMMTIFSPEEILHAIKFIEQNLKRNTRLKWESRTIDIDILFFNDEIFEGNEIQIPHPWLHLRRFVLCPLNEIAPDLMHPVLQKSSYQLLEECIDKLQVSIFNEQIKTY